MKTTLSLQPALTQSTLPARPRVGIVYRMERAGGVQSCALALIRALNRRGIVPDILWDTPPAPRLLAEAGARAGFRRIPLRIGSRLSDRLPYTLRYLANVANAVDGAAFSAEYDFFFVFYNGFLLPPDAPHVRYLSGPPLVPQLAQISPGVRGLPVRLFRWLYARLLRRKFPVYEFHRGSNYVINSQFTAALFEQAHGLALPVISPPIAIPARGFEDDDWPRRDTLTFFSRIIDYKRPHLALELARAAPRLRCVIMGSVPPHRRAYFESLQARARALGLERVIFLDTPSNERVRAELARTRYYFFPAHNEHFGMTTVEAIAAGALPYVHDSGGQREIVPDDRLRFTDEQMLARFEQLMRLPEAEVNRIRRALFDHIGQFSESVFADKMLTLMEQAIPNL